MPSRRSTRAYRELWLLAGLWASNREDYAYSLAHADAHSPQPIMAEIPKDLRYTEDHEYVKSTKDPNIVTVGITDYAQGELGDVVYLELPSVGTSFGKHDVFGTIEAVKAVSELFSPISGEVVEVNSRLEKEPQLVNSDPYGDGWMVRLKITKPAEKGELLDADAYGAHVGQ